MGTVALGGRAGTARMPGCQGADSWSCLCTGPFGWQGAEFGHLSRLQSQRAHVTVPAFMWTGGQEPEMQHEALPQITGHVPPLIPYCFGVLGYVLPP